MYAVTVTKQHTVTASGDGFLKFWKNSVTEVDAPRDNVESVFIDKTGLHHVDSFQDTFQNERMSLIATVTFSGRIVLLRVTQQGGIERLDVDLEAKSTYWAVRFLKDHLGKAHKLAATTPCGVTKIWNFEIGDDGVPSFTAHGEVKSQSGSFATCLDLNSEQNILATGYQNGDVVLTQLDTAKAVYTFRSFGLKGSSQSSSSVRCVRFSPLGKILSIASDSGSYGTVTLYDTKYGENVGSLTIPSHSTSTSVGAYAHENWVFEVDFNESGEHLATAGYDGKVRIWNVETREREATLNLSPTDVDDEDIVEEEDGLCSAVGVKFIPPGVRGGAGGDSNDGLVVISLDRGIRWYREAGGI